MSEDTKENKLEFDVMPGADRSEEESEAVDLNFEVEDETETVVESEDTTEEVVAETEQEETTAEVEEEPEAEPESEEEPVAEAEEEPVAEAEEEPEPVETESKKPMVPKTRLDEVLAKQRALEKQLDAMKAAKQEPEAAPDEYNFSDKEVEYQNLLLDGESEKAARLRTEIRQAERAQIEYELSSKFEKQYDQNQQLTALQQAAAELEASFPVFRQGSDSYNEQYTNEVVELRDAFIVKGENAVAALSKAAKFVVREYDLDPVSESKPSLSDTSSKSIVDEVAKKRAEVSKKLKAADKQPPELPGEGSGSRGEQPLDVSQLSEEEFDALPEATLRRLRGDVL